MNDKKEMTALITSVSADDGQSLNTISSNNILNETDDFNSFFEENQLINHRLLDPSHLKTVSMAELYDTVYQNRPPLIDGLLYPGTYLFVGAPKLGKSFLMAQLAYHISTGIALWNYPVHKGTVLYLALEDDYSRLQKRLYQMFGTESTENLFFSISASQLGRGLDEQLENFVHEHPDTELIIIDTLQKIREMGGDSYSYASDYDIIARLKQFADNSGICLMLVHHTRKQKSDDPYDMISGTNGLLGAADGAFLLQKEKRTANGATLDISGRDQQDQRLYLNRNPEKLTWELERTEAELWKIPPEPILDLLAKLFPNNAPDWQGTPTELVALLGIEMKPNTLTMKLNINASRLLNEYGIHYESSRSHDGRRITIRHEKPTA